MSHIQLIQKTIFAKLSNKGGVGKSLKACRAAETARKRGTKTLLIDLDANNKNLSKIFGIHDANGEYDFDANYEAAYDANGPRGCLRYDAKVEQDLHALLDLLTSGRVMFEVAIIDFPGGDQRDFNALTGQLSDLTDALIGAGFRIVLDYVIDRDVGAAEGIAPTLVQWGPGTLLRVIKNEKIEKEEGSPFEWYEGLVGGGLKPVDVVKFVGGVEMTVPNFRGVEAFLVRATSQHKPISELPLSFSENVQRVTFTNRFEAALDASDVELATSQPITPEMIAAVKAALVLGVPLPASI